MKILCVGVKNNSQLKRLHDEGQKRGHEVTGCLTSELVIETSASGFKPMLGGLAIGQYDLIYLWAISKRRWEWISTASYLNKKYGTIIVNHKLIDPAYEYYLTPASDYLKQIEVNLPFPKSYIVYSNKYLARLGLQFPVIVKVAAGRQGKGVFKANDMPQLREYVDKISKEITQPAVIREFIPNDGDIRIFTVGYKAIGAMKRTPKEGEFRSNISQGGTGSVFGLDSRDDIRQMAESLSKITKTEIAGVDIIIDKNTNKPYILEINPGPQFTGIEASTGINVAVEIIKYFESLQNSK